MPIRLIKVSKNLNVGINSLVEFLHKKGIEVEANPNVKIEDEHYNILVTEFGKDKSIRLEALETREKLHRRDDKRETVSIKGYGLPEEQAPKKSADKDTVETEIPQELKPQLNVVGSIDLDKLNKKRSPSLKSKPESSSKKKEDTVDKTKTTKIEPIKPEEPDTDFSENSIKVESEVETEAVQITEKELKTEDIPKIEKNIVAEVEKNTTKEAEPITEVETKPEEREDIKDIKNEVIVDIEPKVEEEPILEPTIESQKTEEKIETKEQLVEPIKEEPATKEAETIQIEDTKIEELPSEEDKKDEATTKPEGSRSEKVFRLHKNKLESNIVVKGSIDLSTINDRTRPPRKSRAERKKERLDREQKSLDGKKLKDEKIKLLKKETIDEQKKHPQSADSIEDRKSVV